MTTTTAGGEQGRFLDSRTGKPGTVAAEPPHQILAKAAWPSESQSSPAQASPGGPPCSSGSSGSSDSRRPAHTPRLVSATHAECPRPLFILSASARRVRTAALRQDELARPHSLPPPAFFCPPGRGGQPRQSRLGSAGYSTCAEGRSSPPGRAGGQRPKHTTPGTLHGIVQQART